MRRVWQAASVGLTAAGLVAVSQVDLGAPWAAGIPQGVAAGAYRTAAAGPPPSSSAGGSDAAAGAPASAAPAAPSPAVQNVMASSDSSAADVAVTLASNGIPPTAGDAYRRAAAAAPARCGLSWSLLAAIGRVESNHGRFAGAALHADGRSTPPIIGIALDGVGAALLTDTDHGRLDGDPVYDHAVGPMQFIPSTWARYARDGNGDGRKDPFNIYDATAAAARYLCVAGGNLSTLTGQRRAVLAYNHSDAYAGTVLTLAAWYAGTLPPPLPIQVPGPPPSIPPSIPPANPAPPPAVPVAPAASPAAARTTTAPPPGIAAPAPVGTSPPTMSPSPPMTPTTAPPATTAPPSPTAPPATTSPPPTPSPTSPPPSSTPPTTTPPTTTPPTTTPPTTTLPATTPPPTTPPPTTPPPSTSPPPTTTAPPASPPPTTPPPPTTTSPPPTTTAPPASPPPTAAGCVTPVIGPLGTVDIRNGSGIPTLTTAVAARLTKAGATLGAVTTSAAGNAAVEYPAGQQAAALALAAALGVPGSAQPAPVAHLTVVIDPGNASRLACPG